MSSALVSLNQVSLEIRSVDHPILEDISYQVQEGDFIIVLGSNGSGKSSLLKLLDKRYYPTAGNIQLGGRDLNYYPAKAFSRSVITLTQDYHESLFSSLTLMENFLLVKQRHAANLFSIRQQAERAFLAEYVAQFNPKLALKLDSPVEKLSGGEKQAFALALSVLYPPKLLLLDEHTSALDPKAAKQLMEKTQEIVRQHKITCILTTHDLEIAQQYGNRILALLHGKIYKTIEADEKRSLNQQDLLKVCY